MTDPNIKCVFCDLPLGSEATNKLTDKGVKKIQEVCLRLKLENPVLSGQCVHQACRKKFVDEKEVSRKEKLLEANTNKFSPKKTRSTSIFNFTGHCFLCGEKASIDDKRNLTHQVLTAEKDFDKKMKKICGERKDRWAVEILGRISSVGDLCAADAIYHQDCNIRFRGKKNLNKPNLIERMAPSEISKSAGRPVDKQKQEAFLETAKYCAQICEEKEYCTLRELQDKMNDILKPKNTEPYSIKHLKRRLEDHFRGKIEISSSEGLEDVVFLREKCEDILRQFYSEQRSKDAEEDKSRLLKTVGRLIKAECIEMKQSSKYYPSVSTIESEEVCLKDLPCSLIELLNNLSPGANNNLKKISIAQCIIQMIRPRSFLSPLQVTLGVQLHHLFASKKLIDILHKMGFSISYAEVLKYERNAAMTSQNHFQNLTSGHFTQFIADNVDHNICSLDGKNNFHGMGIISLVTPVLETSKLIPRRTVSSKDICRSGKIQISYYDGREKNILKTYTKLPPLEAEDKFKNLDLLWKMSWLLNPKATNWSGMMQSSTSVSFPGKSSVFFCPIIDLNPNDYSCVYSTLLFVAEEAKKFGVPAVLTFDQPLFWKSLVVIDNEPENSPIKNLVSRIGGFHTVKSFIGCAGHFSESTGIEEVLAQIYGVNTVQQILNGNHYSRAIRAFLLLDAALNYIFIREAFEIPFEGKMNDNLTLNVVNAQNLKDVVALLAGVVENSVAAEEACSANVLLDIEEKLSDYKKSITATSENAKLWFQFMDMMNILRAFLRAERTGDWPLHLKTLQDMLPYFAAAGHSLYLKSSRLYLQNMNELPNTHPDVYQKFMAGFHVGRRSEKYWAGLSTDLMIEQILMNHLKRTGGLTRGSGLTESKRLTWLQAMPACADINSAMMVLLKLDEDCFEYHRDCTPARQKRDLEDLKKIILTLNDMAPFQAGALKNLATGRLADSDVNVHKALEIGKEIMKTMDDKVVSEYSFKKNSTVKTMSSNKILHIDGDVVKVDPYLLFQRLLCIVNSTPGKIAEYFTYELCTYPMSLSDGAGFLRLAKKSEFSDTLSKIVPGSTCVETEITFYVLDGGHLLHLLPWSQQSTYTELFEQYTKYVLKNYGKATIVFDNYSDEFTTKDMTHIRRSKGKTGPTIDFKDNMSLTVAKNTFLSNDKNKQKFLVALGEHLRQSGCTTIRARDDADLQIVIEALKQAEKGPTAIIGKDTDLLALSVHYFNESLHQNLFITGENPIQSSKKNSTKVWNVRQIKETLGKELCEKILFCHAFLGCDCTSHIYGIHKGKILTLLMENESAVADAAIFCDILSSKSSIVTAGQRLLVRLYGGKETEDLDSLRLKMFSKKLASSTSRVKPEVLPPTLAAAKFHFFRVFLQVMSWMEKDLDPEKWGWKRGNFGLTPILSDKAPAPEELLKVIRCGCKEDACNSQRCTCKKHGIPCSFACKGCQGITCYNKAFSSQSSSFGEYSGDEDNLSDEENFISGHYDDGIAYDEM